MALFLQCCCWLRSSSPLFSLLQPAARFLVPYMTLAPVLPAIENRFDGNTSDPAASKRYSYGAARYLNRDLRQDNVKTSPAKQTLAQR